jgi:predicted transcriptional regulator
MAYSRRFKLREKRDLDAAYTITRMLKIRKALGKSYSMEDYPNMSMEEAINALRAERGWK